MATRGRKPKPTPLKILSGDRKDRINSAEPKAPRSVPDCPGHLDDLAREAWFDLIPQLELLGMLSSVDAHALALYCTTYSRWRRARDEAKQFGVTVYTDAGSVKANPACTIEAQAERMMVALLAEFGLTPSSRSRVKSADQKSDDAFAAFLAKANRKA